MRVVFWRNVGKIRHGSQSILQVIRVVTRFCAVQLICRNDDIGLFNLLMRLYQFHGASMQCHAWFA